MVSKDLTLTINLSNYAPIRMTNFIKKKEIENNWLLIDAENAIVGRLAAYISKVLRGKNKNQYTPHMDNGDFVVVTNIENAEADCPELTAKAARPPSNAATLFSNASQVGFIIRV